MRTFKEVHLREITTSKTVGTPFTSRDYQSLKVAGVNKWRKRVVHVHHHSKGRGSSGSRSQATLQSTKAKGSAREKGKKQPTTHSSQIWK